MLVMLEFNHTPYLPNQFGKNDQSSCLHLLYLYIVLHLTIEESKKKNQPNTRYKLKLFFLCLTFTVIWPNERLAVVRES